MKKIVVTKTAKETMEYAAEVLREHPRARIFLLVGDLGSGKTTFVKGCAKALGVREAVLSPTFVLIQKYDIPKQRGDRKSGPHYSSLYHIDLYRLKSIDEDTRGHLQEIFDDKKAIAVVEWADRLPKDMMPSRAIIIQFEYINESSRRIVL